MFGGELPLQRRHIFFVLKLFILQLLFFVMGSSELFLEIICFNLQIIYLFVMVIEGFG